MIQIRKAHDEDLPRLMEIFAHARHFMAANGNPHQWIDGYPSADLIRNEIKRGHCQVCTDETGHIVGTFCYIEGEDPNYAVIEGGEWLNDRPYAIIHRLATSGEVRGVAEACFGWCAVRHRNIRVDTHEDNKVLQHILDKYDFTYCGIIYVANGTPRRAYQRFLL